MFWKDMLTCRHHIFSYLWTVQIVTWFTDSILSESDGNSAANADCIVIHPPYLVFLTSLVCSKCLCTILAKNLSKVSRIGGDMCLLIH